MNWRNKKLVTTVRVLLGLFLIFSGIAGFMAAGNEWEGIPPAMLDSTKTLWDIGIFQMIKLTEIIAGIMLLIGFLPWLAAIALVPLCVGIIVFHFSVNPEGVWGGIVVVVLTLYLGYAYWDRFKRLFERK